jgi:hypothetical protein
MAIRPGWLASLSAIGRGNWASNLVLRRCYRCIACCRERFLMNIAA